MCAELEIEIDEIVNIESSSGGYRTLITFTLPGDISSSDIEYAKLMIPYAYIEAELDLIVCTVATTWEKATVSWNYPWTYPGGDYDDYPQSRLHLYPDYPENKEYFFDISENVRNMADGTDNYGLLIKPSQEFGSSFNDDILSLLEDNDTLIIKLYLSGN